MRRIASEDGTNAFVALVSLGLHGAICPVNIFVEDGGLVAVVTSFEPKGLEQIESII